MKHLCVTLIVVVCIGACFAADAMGLSEQIRDGWDKTASIAFVFAGIWFIGHWGDEDS